VLFSDEKGLQNVFYPLQKVLGAMQKGIRAVHKRSGAVQKGIKVPHCQTKAVQKDAGVMQGG